MLESVLENADDFLSVEEKEETFVATLTFDAPDLAALEGLDTVDLEVEFTTRGSVI